MKLRYRIAIRIIYWTWKLLFGFKIEGWENIPKKGGVIIAPNHLSNFDPPLVGAAVWFRECYLFTKQELFVINKFYTWLIKAFNAYEVNTKGLNKTALKHTEKLLKNGLAIMFFPEGTRSLSGHFLEFHPGVAWLALRCEVPVVPTLVKGTNTPLIKQFIRKEKVCVRFGKPVIYDSLLRDLSAGRQAKLPREARAIISKEVERRIKNLSVTNLPCPLLRQAKRDGDSRKVGN
ncbi:1-acyl-sn-glycerol-3-phosphate acyltransferase [candidate division WOR-3 bacterium]|nr:1-acyl-sn-glycerol-3-phosphate acyltransferase [candidate division WOR-3 bacterium]